MKVSNPVPKKMLTASQEDYLEAVLDLTSERKVTRNKEIADKIGVKRATVTRALKLLVQKGLIEHETHGYVALTGLGRNIAVEITARHRLFSHFFKDILELDQSEADAIACKIEHMISGKALNKFRCFIEKIDNGEKRNGE